MAKILFLTYYYFPCNATGSNRPASFAENFTRHGHQVTVITRHWTGSEKVWSDYLKGDEREPEIKHEGGITIHSLPIKSFRYSSLFFSLPITIYKNLKGEFNYELQFSAFNSYIEQILSNETFDYIYASTPPLTVLKVAAKFGKQFNIPLLVDVRDFENDILLYKQRQHGWFRQQQHTILIRHFKNWIKQNDVIFTASPPLTNYIKKIGFDAFTLTNGFKESLLSVNEPQDENNFTITVTGTLYQMANLSIMLDGINLIILRHPDAKVKFQFIGLLANPEVSEMFRAVIPEDKIVLTNRIPQAEAMKKASASHVLLLAGFDTMTGAYTTKIFEYLGLRRHVLQIPGDRDVVEDLIHETQCGKAPHTAEEAYNVIMEWYEEWRTTKTLAYHGRHDRIMQYSREKQFEKLLERLTV